MEDHLYTLHLKKKVNTPLYLSAVENILDKSLTEILGNLKNSYSESGDNIVYVTICQKSLVNPIRSGTYHLQDNELAGLVNHIMASFNRFCNSNKQIRLDDTFEIYFKVLSSESISDKKHRRKRVPLRGLVGSKTTSTILLPGGLIDLPTTFPNKKNSLENMCLLSTVIFGYLKHADKQKYEQIKQICFKKSTQATKNLGASLLMDEITKFCVSTNVPKTGPHDFETVLPKLAEFYNIQVHLIQSMDNSRKVSKISAPEGNNLNRYRIYLYQINSTHVVLIDNLKQFFGYNKRKVCFDCGQFSAFAFKINSHRCHAKQNCDLCLGCFETCDTVKINHEIIDFCDSQVKTEMGLSCLKCCFTFKTNVCYQNHTKACNSDKLRIKCHKCNVYYLTWSKNNHKLLKAEHVCGVWPKRCHICKKISTDNFHVCQIRKEEFHSSWPNLGFINMKFKSNSSSNCQKCYCLKETFKTENKLTLKELFLHKNFDTLICEDHKSILVKDDLPNLVSLFCEEKSRFHFKERLFADRPELLMFAEPTNIELPYCENPIKMTSTVYKQKPCKKSMSNQFYNLLKKVSQPKTALDEFFLFLCNKENNLSNYTFIVESNTTMLTILRYFLKLQVIPSLIQKASTINLLEVSGLQIKFILKSSYLSGNIFDIGLQYGINFEKTFFPDVLNKPVNYNYVGEKPDFEKYLLFTDTREEINLKKQFYESLNEEWNFNEQLILNFQNESLVSLKAILKFVQEGFKLQKTLSAVTGKPENAIHPFNGRIMSLSGFSYALFHFYYYNDVDGFSVANSDILSGRTQTSRPEFEYISWLNFKTGNFIQGAFNSPEGQKSFGRYSVDGYDAKTKTVYQFQG